MEIPRFANPQRRFTTPAAVIAASLIAGLLLYLPPDRYSFYPACPIHQLTGLLCPGCGGTRALAALLRGELSAALHLNALLVGLIPFALAYAVLALSGKQDHRLPEAAAWTVAGATVAFTIARNL